MNHCIGQAAYATGFGAIRFNLDEKGTGPVSGFEQVCATAQRAYSIARIERLFMSFLPRISLVSPLHLPRCEGGPVPNKSLSFNVNDTERESLARFDKVGEFTKAGSQVEGMKTPQYWEDPLLYVPGSCKPEWL
jgi:hypothetical protein